MAAATRSSRWILIVAALVALVAITVAVTRGVQNPAPAVTQSDAPVTSATNATNPKAAITQLEAKLKDNPKDARGWRFLGMAHRDAGNFAESAMAYKQSTVLDPANSEGWSAMGEALALAGTGPNMPEARAAFRTALEKDPADPLAAYYLAAAKDMDGDHKGAIDDWFAILARSPADAPWISDIRKAITSVASKNKIDVTARLAATKPAAPIGGIATAAIPGASREAMQNAAQLPKGQQDAMVSQMVDGLDKKLVANPKNVDGWIMLMRSRVTLGETVKAKAALAAAKAANPGDSAKLDTAAGELGL
jgi:cytochrome c-type biogenesis protein CcmH